MWSIIGAAILAGIGLSCDAFAVSVTDGLTYTDINKKRGVFIATVFGVMQAVMPLIGYWLIELIEVLVSGAGEKAGEIMEIVVTWLAFALLMFIGGKMLIEAIKESKKPEEEKEPKKFSVKEVLIMGVATAIDAMAMGVAFHTNKEGMIANGFDPNIMIWLQVSIIMVCTFVISLFGVFLAKQVQKLFKGKFEITGIIGGCILILLGIWVVVSHYTGIGF